MAGPQCSVPAPPCEHESSGSEELIGPFLSYISHPPLAAPKAAVILVSDVFGFKKPLLRTLLVCGKKGHTAVGCTRRRVPADIRQQAVDLEKDQPSSIPPQAGIPSPQRRRSDAEKARRREAKKKKRQKAQQVQIVTLPRPLPKDAKVYRRRAPPTLPIASSSNLLVASSSFDGDPLGHYSGSSGIIIPVLTEAARESPSSSSLSDSSRRDLLPLSELLAQYEKQFPPLKASCTPSIVRRSERSKTKT